MTAVSMLKTSQKKTSAAWVNFRKGACKMQHYQDYKDSKFNPLKALALLAIKAELLQQIRHLQNVKIIWTVVLPQIQHK